MKIGINFLNSGLGNNGGTRTLLKSANALEQLGHEVALIATVDKFTWFPHKEVVSDIPNDLDVLIASAGRTVPSTLDANTPVKAWYIRGHENWSLSEQQLEAHYNSGLLNIVNSKWLQQKLASMGASSTVVYQGVDLNDWHDIGIRKANKKIRVGSLYSKKVTKRWADFVRLAERLGNQHYEYVAFGTDPCPARFLTSYVSNPSLSKLVELYSSCHIWFAPTVLEGLHNVPMEAALCGCLVVCNDQASNGMLLDYAFPGKTAMVYHSLETAAKYIERPRWELVTNMQDHIRKNICSRKQNMKKLIKIFTKELSTAT